MLDTMSNISYTRSMCFDRWLLLAAATSVASTIASHRLLDRMHAAPAALRLVIALAPIVFFILLILAQFRWLRAQDEFHRRIALESLAIAFPLVIAEAVTVEALQRAGFLTTITIGTLWPYMALTWVLSFWIAQRRYR